jgi:glycosyltransferase involved in cell wall biosynthesis
MARIVTVYHGSPRASDRAYGGLVSLNMAYIRWLRMSEELARLGHTVDVAVADELAEEQSVPLGSDAPSPRRIPMSRVHWGDYDVVKTEYFKGFETLERFGGGDHPFIIAHLGSTVAPEDRDGIYFYGEGRARRFAAHQRIERTARYVSLLTPPARELWEEQFGPRERLLVVPGAADRHIPPPGRDPYPPTSGPKVLFAGNVYSLDTQPEANAILVDKLNRLGSLLAARGVHLFMIGTGELGALDRRVVTYAGAIPYQHSWDYLHYADVGIVVAPGPFLHNNESTKIYSYLRAGLPTVSEAGFPNDGVVAESGLGYVVENGNLELMAEKILEAANREWDRDAAVRYILNHHTWDRRAETYQPILP